MNILQEIYNDIKQDPEQQYGTISIDKTLRLIQKYTQLSNQYTVWISKDGNKIDNMSFFGTKKDAQRFNRATKGRDKLVKATLIIE